MTLIEEKLLNIKLCKFYRQQNGFKLLRNRLSEEFKIQSNNFSKFAFILKKRINLEIILRKVQE